MIEESELFDQATDTDPIFCTWATVGHPGDPDVVDLGSGDNDGVTLVKVTLKHGAPVGEPMAKDGGFNGQRITAQVGAPSWTVPARGTRVVVMFPDGDIISSGNGVIVFQAGQSPTRRFGRQKTVMDFAGKDLVISAKSIALAVETADGHRHVMSLSGEGGAQVVSDGSGLFIKDGEVNLKTISGDGDLMNALVMGQEEASLMCCVDSASFAALRLSPSVTELSGGFVTLNFATNLYLGAGATAANTVLWGASGVAGLPAARVLVQPI